MSALPCACPALQLGSGGHGLLGRGQGWRGAVAWMAGPSIPRVPTG